MASASSIPLVSERLMLSADTHFSCTSAPIFGIVQEMPGHRGEIALIAKPPSNGRFSWRPLSFLADALEGVARSMGAFWLLITHGGMIAVRGKRTISGAMAALAA